MTHSLTRDHTHDESLIPISLLKYNITTEAQTTSSALKVCSPRSMNTTDCWRSRRLVIITAAHLDRLRAAYTSAAVSITVASFPGRVSVSSSPTDALLVDQAGSSLTCY